MNKPRTCDKTRCLVQHAHETFEVKVSHLNRTSFYQSLENTPAIYKVINQQLDHDTKIKILEIKARRRATTVTLLTVYIEQHNLVLSTELIM